MTKPDWKAAWNAFVGWKGWKKIFPMPFWLELVLFAGCCGGLVWVFTHGMEQSMLAYAIYPVSAYSLTALCTKIPGILRMERNWLTAHPKTAQRIKDQERKFKRKLYQKQFINFGYGIFKIAAGVVIGSAWIGADGIYNLAQALIQLFQILRRKNPGTLVHQWRSYRLCGVLMLLLHLTLIGIVFQMVNWNRVEDQGEIMVIATAAFAFYKLVSSFVEMAKDRKHIRPIDSSVRMLELSQAIFAIFSLQAGLLRTFGTGEAWEHWMNFATGCVVCLSTASMGVYMIRRGKREIRTLEETKNGA